MDPRLRQGVDLFNRGEYFESHEVLEGLYHDTADENKAFLEGLIGLAAAFRMFRDFSEIRGPVRMIYQALIRLENFQPSFLEIDVQALCRSAEAWAKTAEAAPDARSRLEIPRIKFKGFRFFS